MLISEKTVPGPPQQSQRKSELHALTGLRFFAAAYVVLYHFLSPNLRTSFAPLTNLLSVGYSAVGFFFVLSGFVLTYSYVRRNGHVTLNRVSFWKARFSRIYPAYLFAFLIAAPFQIAGSIHINGLLLAAKKLAVGSALVLTLLQAWTPWTVWYWNIPAWSLSVEVFFYFCFPFVVLLIAGLRPRQCLKWGAIIWLLGLLAPAAYCALRPVSPQPPFAMLQLAIETNPVLRLPEFLLGMLLGRIFGSGFRFSAVLAATLSIAALAMLTTLLAFSSFMPRLLLSNSVLVPASALLIFALAHQSGWLANSLSHPALRLLGEASYAIYILQYPVSQLFHLNSQTYSVQRFSLYLVSLIALSVLTFLFIEQPLRRRLKRRRDLPKSESIATSPIPRLIPRLDMEA